jgi:hypothetical protein
MNIFLCSAVEYIDSYSTACVVSIADGTERLERHIIPIVDGWYGIMNLKQTMSGLYLRVFTGLPN